MIYGKKVVRLIRIDEDVYNEIKELARKKGLKINELIEIVFESIKNEDLEFIKNLRRKSNVECNFEDKEGGGS